MSTENQIIRPIKKNVKLYSSWKDAHLSLDKGPLLVILPFNEYKEPKFARGLPGQMFTVNVAIPFLGQYYICFSNLPKDQSNNLQSNSLLQTCFKHFKDFELITSSVILVKTNPNGDIAYDSIVKKHIIDVPENVFQDISDLIKRYNNGIQLIENVAAKFVNF